LQTVQLLKEGPAQIEQKVLQLEQRLFEEFKEFG
jgi:hypothetical protein